MSRYVSKQDRPEPRKHGINRAEDEGKDIRYPYSRKRDFQNAEDDTDYAPKKKLKDDNDEEYQYFVRALSGIGNIDDDEQRVVVLKNILKKTVNEELQLSCQGHPSQCFELALDNCEDPDVVIRFMKAFSEDMATAFTNKFASHISEKLLLVGLKMLKKPTLDAKTSVNTAVPNDEDRSYIVISICKFAEFFTKYFWDAQDHEYASHVLKTLIQVLGFYFVSQDICKSKKSQNKNNKNNFPVKCNDMVFGVISKEETSNIPKKFLKSLKKIIKVILGYENIEECFGVSESSSVIQTLLLVAKQRVPKYASKLLQHLLSKVFSEVTELSIPLAFVQKKSSFIVEKIFEVSDEEQQLDIWTQMNQYLDGIVQHHIGNFVIQRMFDIVQDEKVFQVMSETIVARFKKIMTHQRYGVLLSFAKACNRLNSQQALFTNSLMECLDCSEPNRYNHFASLVLCLHEFGSEFSPVAIKYHGSLLVQELLKFQKPIKIVRSIINMEPKVLETLACHTQACHVYTSFLECILVGEKNKDMLINKLKPVVASIAQNESGNFTLWKIWGLTSLKQRCILAEELWENRESLSECKSASILLKKCSIRLYKVDVKKWKEVQSIMLKKKQFMRDIINDN